MIIANGLFRHSLSSSPPHLMLFLLFLMLFFPRLVSGCKKGEVDEDELNPKKFEESGAFGYWHEVSKSEMQAYPMKTISEAVKARLNYKCNKVIHLFTGATKKTFGYGLTYKIRYVLNWEDTCHDNKRSEMNFYVKARILPWEGASSVDLVFKEGNFPMNADGLYGDYAAKESKTVFKKDEEYFKENPLTSAQHANDFFWKFRSRALEKLFDHYPASYMARNSNANYPKLKVTFGLHYMIDIWVNVRETRSSEGLITWCSSCDQNIKVKFDILVPHWAVDYDDVIVKFKLI